MNKNRTIQAWMGVMVLLFISCSGMKNASQYTGKIQVSAFVTELYSTVSKTITIDHVDAAHISWMGFIESNDYRFFKVTEMRLGNTILVSEGLDYNGTVYTPNSNAIFSDITVPAPVSSTSEVSLSTDTSSRLSITIEYSPQTAIVSESDPHNAYLIVQYDAPDTGALRLELTGKTYGIKDEKCARDPAAMDVIEYKVVNNAFDLYFCSAEVAKKGQSNTTTDPSSSDYHGASSNLATVPLPDGVIRFYMPDDETACIMTGNEPSIPNFDLPIPEGLGAPITSMPISIVEGSYAECGVDRGSGTILCDDTIQIEALVSLSTFSMTNGSFTKEELTTTDCPDFGSISGSGQFGSSPLTLVMYGKTLSDTNTEEFNIVDSLIVGVINLE